MAPQNMVLRIFRSDDRNLRLLSSVPAPPECLVVCQRLRELEFLSSQACGRPDPVRSPQHCVSEGPCPLKEEDSMQGQIFPALRWLQEENPCDGHLKPVHAP